MDKILGVNNKLMSIINWAADLLLLNLLYILTCIPVITIGAATAALYDIILKMVKGEEGYIFKGYFKAFGNYFKRATGLWVLEMGAGALIGLDLFFYGFIQGNKGLSLLNYLFCIVFICCLFVFSYQFVVLVTFKDNIRTTIRKSFVISIRRLPYTVCIVLLNILPVILVLLVPFILPYMLLVQFIIGFSGIAFINSRLFHKVFETYL